MVERTELPVRIPRRSGVLALSVLAALAASLAATIIEPALLLGIVLAAALLVLD